MSLKENTPKLGRGLAALLGDTSISQGPTVLEADPDRISDIILEYITPGKYQPRQHFDIAEIENLAQSIKENGLLQPILVRRVSDNAYELIAGERRWRAMKTLGFSTIPAIVKDFSEKESLSVALVENIQRENLSPIEEARALDKLIVSLDHTQEEVGKSIGKSRSYVTNAVRLLQLPAFVVKSLESNIISVGHARALLGLSEEAAQEILSAIMRKHLNVRQVEALVRQHKRGGLPQRESTFIAPRESSQDMDADTKAIEEHVTDKLGLSAQIDVSQGQGSIILRVKSLDELDAFMAKISIL